MTDGNEAKCYWKVYDKNPRWSSDHAATQPGDRSTQYLTNMLESDKISRLIDDLANHLVKRMATVEPVTPPPSASVTVEPAEDSSEFIETVPLRKFDEMANHQRVGSLMWQIYTCLGAISAPQVKDGWAVIILGGTVLVSLFLAVMVPIVGTMTDSMKTIPAETNAEVSEEVSDE